jgi:hypothetical protein
MLVFDNEAELLDRLKVGDQIQMTFSTPEGGQPTDFRVTHITPFKADSLGAYYHVGLCIS